MSSKGLYISVNADAALRKLKKIEKAFDESIPVISELTTIMGERAEEVAKFLCPVDTGELQRSIHFIGKYPRITLVANAKGTNGYPYGISVEFGSSIGHRPTLFMTQGINVAIAEFKEQVKNELIRKFTEE